MTSSQRAFAALLARAPAAYRFLGHIERDGWAWEYLRRSTGYASAWSNRSPATSLAASNWDLCSFRRSRAYR